VRRAIPAAAQMRRINWVVKSVWSWATIPIVTLSTRIFKIKRLIRGRNPRINTNRILTVVQPGVKVKTRRTARTRSKRIARRRWIIEGKRDMLFMSGLPVARSHGESGNSYPGFFVLFDLKHAILLAREENDPAPWFNAICREIRH
jgi:hypothetical protein